MHHAFTPNQAELTRLAAPVECIGFLVLTAVTNNDGQTSYQHSKIYRSEDEAVRAAAAGMRKLHIWEREIARTVQEVRTCFPFADVLAGKATRWGDCQLACEGVVRKVAA